MVKTKSHSASSPINTLDWIALGLLIFGGLDLGASAAFGVDLVDATVGSQSHLGRLVYLAVAAAAVWGLSLFLRAQKRRIRRPV